MPLEDEHFYPVQHTRRNKRVWSTHSRAALHEYLVAQTLAEQAIEREAQEVATLNSTLNTAVNSEVTSACATLPSADPAAPHTPEPAS